jgi:hypothetical protein
MSISILMIIQLRPGPWTKSLQLVANQRTVAQASKPAEPFAKPQKS